MGPSQTVKQTVYWGFHTSRSGIAPGVVRFGPRVVKRCTCIEIFLIKGWDLIITRCDGSSSSSGEATLAACCVNAPSPSLYSNQPVDLGFEHLFGGIYPGDARFHARVVEVADIWKGSWSGDGALSPPGRRDLTVIPRRNSRRVPGPCHP